MSSTWWHATDVKYIIYCSNTLGIWPRGTGIRHLLPNIMGFAALLSLTNFFQFTHQDVGLGAPAMVSPMCEGAGPFQLLGGHNVNLTFKVLSGHAFQPSHTYHWDLQVVQIAPSPLSSFWMKHYWEHLPCTWHWTGSLTGIMSLGPFYNPMTSIQLSSLSCT